MSTIPDGYEPWGEQGIVLIDPEVCPRGHPFQFGQRSANAICDAPGHDHHHAWLCACGQWIYRVPGAFVDRLDCR